MASPPQELPQAPETPSAEFLAPQPSPTCDREGGETLPRPYTLSCMQLVHGRSDWKRRVEVFIMEYLQDFNQERAASIAWPEGSVRAMVRGYECLHHPEIAAAIRYELNQRAQHLMIDPGSLLNKLATLIYDDDVKPGDQIKATELAMKFRGMLHESSSVQVNVLVGIAERLADAKKELEEK